jgi:hypothetical protein
VTMIPNNCPQAAPGSALGEFPVQHAGAPEAERSRDYSYPGLSNTDI